MYIDPPLMFSVPVPLVFAVPRLLIQKGFVKSTVTTPPFMLKVPLEGPVGPSPLPMKTVALVTARLPPFMLNVAVMGVACEFASAMPKKPPPAKGLMVPVAFQFTTAAPWRGSGR